MADAAEAAAPGGNLSLEHGLGRIAEQKVDVADNAIADQRLAIASARGHRGDAIGEFHLANRAERLRARGAVHRTAIDIDRGDDVMAGGDVVGQFLDHVAQTAAIPQMMMRVDDRPRGVDDLFGVLGEPVLARIGVEPASCRRQ